MNRPEVKCIICGHVQEPDEIFGREYECLKHFGQSIPPTELLSEWEDYYAYKFNPVDRYMPPPPEPFFRRVLSVFHVK